MAASSFQLFVAQIQSGPEAVKTRVLQIIFDVLMVHENEFLGQEGENVNPILDALLFCTFNLFVLLSLRSSSNSSSLYWGKRRLTRLKPLFAWDWRNSY